MLTRLRVARCTGLLTPRRVLRYAWTLTASWSQRESDGQVAHLDAKVVCTDERRGIRHFAPAHCGYFLGTQLVVMLLSRPPRVSPAGLASKRPSTGVSRPSQRDQCLPAVANKAANLPGNDPSEGTNHPRIPQRTQKKVPVAPEARTAFEAIPRPLRLRDASATLEKPHSWTAASSVSSLCTQGQILAVFRRGTWLPPPNPIGPSPDGPPLQGVFWSLSCDWRSS